MDNVQVRQCPSWTMSELKFFCVCVCVGITDNCPQTDQDRHMDTDTRANQYQLATAADNQYQLTTTADV